MAELAAVVSATSTTQVELTVPGHLYGYLTITTPLSILASGTAQPPNSVDVTLPALSLAAYIGASCIAVLPTFTLSASGTVPGIGRVDAALPALTLVASGMAGGASAAYLQFGGQYSVTAYSGAQVRLTHGGDYPLTSQGLTGGIANAVLSIDSAYDVSSSVTLENYGSAYLVGPALTAAPSGTAWLVSPSLTMHAVGGEVVAVSYEAYAVNLENGGVTHYTNYPFDNILRLGSHYYGVSSTGLMEIGGAVDDGTEIAASIETFQSNFDGPNMKRVPYVYIAGRASGGVIVGVSADEGETYEYPSDWGEVPGNTNHRTKIGNGLRGVYYALSVRNDAGGSLEIDSVAVHVAPTQRAV